MTIRTVEFARPVDSWAQLPEDGLPEVAVVGRSNVGKSSLLNALVGRRQLARTSQTPGKTQALNYYRVEAGGEKGEPPQHVFYLVDLPGYGYAKVAKTQRASWQRLAERYIAERERLSVVCQLIDSRHEPQPIDLALISQLREELVPFVIALTKTDKISKNQAQSRVAGIRRLLAASGMETPIVATSAEKKVGVDELWDWIGVLLA